MGWMEAAGPEDSGPCRNGCKRSRLIILLQKMYLLHPCLEAWHSEVHVQTMPGRYRLLLALLMGCFLYLQH